MSTLSSTVELASSIVSAHVGRRLLALDLPPGERFAEALDAAWRRDDAVLPLDPLAPPAAKAAVLAEMRPHAVVDADGETRYDDPAPLDPDVALVITTSGSTGWPKGAQLSHAALDASADATAERLGGTAGDVWLSCLPWQHIGGLQVLLRARRAKSEIVIQPRFDPVAIRAAIDTGATLTSLVPTTLARLLDEGVNLSTLKAILLGGAAAPASLLDAARAAVAPVVTTYGMSETCGGCVYDGLPLRGVEVTLAADGRIMIGGPTVMVGYRLRPDLDIDALRDGRLVTGDLGEWDARGRLRVLGRADDVIVTGGEKVAAAALAGVIGSHPLVRDAAVVGRDDPEWGQRVVAVVEPTMADGADQLSLGELRDWLADRLPAWSLPRALIIVATLPRLASGKVDRLAVQELSRRG
jgi:O-succinylbenzoic acid--CoA ligase